MDKLARSVNLRTSHKLMNPIIFAANVPSTYYKSGVADAMYSSIMQQFKRQQNISKAIWLPNIVSPSMTIEDRSQLLSQRIGDIAKNYNPGQKFHLVTHSFCGIDARAAISLNGAFEHGVTSLTTVCSPHLGCSLVDHRERDVEGIAHMERAFEIVGLSG